MERHSRRLALSAAFGLAAALVMMFGLSGVAAAQGPPPGTDHFLCYEATETTPNPPITISLDDQFGPPVTVQAATALEICNPTAKTVLVDGVPVTTPIVEEDLHLTLYELTHKLPTTRRRVVVNNQFGEGQTLRTAALRVVAVPTLKNDPTGNERDLTDISHFACYEATGRRVLVEADVDDQFQDPAATILVHAPHFFCNPAVKIRAGFPPTTIKTDEDHLVCYKVTPSENPPGVTSVTAENQFEGFVADGGGDTFQIGPLHFLCVPSQKVSCNPPTEDCPAPAP